MAEGKLEDFGEFIAGAKKHNYTNFTGQDFSNEKTRSLPLSKLWTTKEIEEIQDKEVAAVAKVLRDSIPTKPRKTYQLNTWFNKLQSAQDIVRSMLDPDNPLTAKVFIQTALDKNIAGSDKMSLLTKLDRADWNIVGDAMVMTNMSTSVESRFILKIEISGKNHWIDAQTLDKANVIDEILPTIKEKIDDAKALNAENANSPKLNKVPEPGDFEIYRRNQPPEREFYIAARADKKHNPLIVFKTVEEARDYRRNHADELAKLWDKYKELYNIKKSDMRSRLNEPRAGTDYRDGRDITPEIFMETFNVRGGQFGNWVNDEERTAMLNNAYDGFMDLSKATNIPPSAIGLNGTLGIAFGARGSGWASAHYEPGEQVINLTKTRGAGSLAHEWWHALDHYMSGHSDLMTRRISNGTRHQELTEPVSDLVKKINKSELYIRSEKADELRNKPYFQTTVEMTARAFEGYVVSELAKENIRNDFLANVVPMQSWQKASEAYPYPTHAELEIFSPVYKEIFETLNTVDKSFETTELPIPHINEIKPEISEPDISPTIEPEVAISAIDSEPLPEDIKPNTEQKEMEVSPTVTEPTAIDNVMDKPEAKTPTDSELQPSQPQEQQRASSTLGQSKQDQYLQAIADRLLEQIQNNQAPWQQPFQAGDIRNSVPVNRDGVPYRGLNAINLASQAFDKGYQDNRWYTFNGAIAEGGKVKKGEKATQIHFWQFSKTEKDEQGQEKTVKLDRPIFRTFYVFNAEQIEGLPERKINVQLMTEFERHARAEAILSQSGVAIEHTPIEKGYFSAHYSPSTDIITLPPRELFNTESEYYATALHELAHATGHESRLNRPLNTNFGSYEYAKEELRAEIASMFIGEELQIGHDPSNHHAYLQHWAELLKNDPREFFKATKDADQIAQYIMTFDIAKEKVMSQDQQFPPYQTLPQNQEYISQNFPIANAFIEYFDPQTNSQIIESGLSHNSAYATIKAENSSIDIHLKLLDDSNPSLAVQERNTIQVEKWNDIKGDYDVLATFAANEENFAKALTVALEHKDLNNLKSSEQFYSNQAKQENRVYLYTSFNDLDELRKLKDQGIVKFDTQHNVWYANENNKDAVTRWIVRPSVPTPAQELSDFMRSRGINVEPGHPKFDGKSQRLCNEGSTDKNVRYKAYDNPTGVPFARIINFSRSSVPEDWIYPLEYINALKNIEAVERAKRGSDKAYEPSAPVVFEPNSTTPGSNKPITVPEKQIEAEKIKADNMADISKMIANISQIAPPTQNYLSRKQVTANDIVLIIPDSSKLPDEYKDRVLIADTFKQAKYYRQNHADKLVLQRGNLAIPQYNIQGEIRAFETIAYNGGKYALGQGADKQGLMTTLGKLENGEPIIVTEGYATGATLHEYTRKNKPAVVIAFGRGGLMDVTQSLREKYPDSKIYIGADNDHQKPMEIDPVTQQPKINQGLEDAKAVANMVSNTHLLVPQFEKGDTGKDWNDVYVDKGEKEFKRQIIEQLNAINRPILVEKDKEKNITQAPIDVAKEPIQQQSLTIYDRLSINVVKKSYPTIPEDTLKGIEIWCEKLSKQYVDEPLKAQVALERLESKLPDYAKGEILPLPKTELPSLEKGVGR